MTIKAGIINVTGYAGMELVRILRSHSEVELAAVTGRSAAGEQLDEYLPAPGQDGLAYRRAG